MSRNQAVDAYERLVCAAGDTIERAQLEAFERLTPPELDELFARFIARTEISTETSSGGAPSRRKPRLIVRMLRAALTGWIWWGSAAAALTIVGGNYGVPPIPWAAWNYYRAERPDEQGRPL